MYFVFGLIPLLSFVASAWHVCDVTSSQFGAKGDGVSDDTTAIRSALAACDEVVLPLGSSFLSGPVNLTSHQRLRVDGTFLASQDKNDYPLVAPLLGYGWGDDMNCFPPDASPHKIVVGSLRYAPVIGAFHAKNVSVVGRGIVDGQGEPWWTNCTLCHYPPTNDSSFCMVATRPKLMEFQFVDGLEVSGASLGAPLTLKDSPFWTLTPSYSQNIYIRDLRITAPMDRIGNTDGCNLDSCRNALVENLWINNSDDGVCIKSGLDGYGMNLAIATENVLIRNITCGGGRCGFALGSEMSGGMRNITYRDSSLSGDRGINVKTSVGRGGYIRDVIFENIQMGGNGISLRGGTDGIPLAPGNKYVPFVDNVKFVNISDSVGCNLGCAAVNGSVCHRMSTDHCKCDHCDLHKPTPRYTCKTTANTEFSGTITLPWGVCIPDDSPVNNIEGYPNWGPTDGDFQTLEACQAVCVPGHEPFMPSQAIV